MRSSILIFEQPKFCFDFTVVQLHTYVLPIATQSNPSRFAVAFGKHFLHDACRIHVGTIKGKK